MNSIPLPVEKTKLNDCISYAIKRPKGGAMQRVLFLIMIILMLVACVGGQVKTGSSGSKSPATGSAAGATTEGANSELERCDTALGTLAVYEDRHAHWYHYLSRYGIQSTVPVLRLFAQQSGCFVVVERGKAFKNAQEERRLQDSGELRQGSNFGKGQMVSADYTMTPTLIFSDRKSGGIGGAIGGLIGGSVGAALGGSVNVKSAQSMLTLTDNRSTVQVATAEGSAQGMDLGAISGLFGSSAGGVLGAYTKTPEGKVIVGAMLDSYNNMIRAVRNYTPQAASGAAGHGTGGKLQVDGATTSSVSNSASATTAPDKATTKEMQEHQKRINQNFQGFLSKHSPIPD
jgi:hypothetical protein